MDKRGSVVVIGAGIAGMQASLDLAESGYKVYLVEKEQSIGGNMVKLDKTFPTGDCAMCTISPKMVAVSSNSDIEKLTMSQVVNVEGDPGNFTITIRRKPKFVIDDKCNGCGECAEVCPSLVPSEFDFGIRAKKAIDIPFPQAVPLIYAIDRRYCIDCKLCDAVCGKDAINFNQKDEELKLNAGAIIVSTGYELLDPSGLEEYGYGKIKNVISNLQFERILSPSGPTSGHVRKPTDGKSVKKIAFIQCVGSRDVRHNPYCSQICCMASTKEAVVAKEHDSEIDATILYMDLRSFGKGFQEYVNKAKDDFGVNYIRGRVAYVSENPTTFNPIVHYENTEKGKPETLEVDLVVLASALKPSSTATKLSNMLGIEINNHGFFKEISPDKPFETLKPGIYINGTCRGPKDIPDSVSESSGAAAKAEVLLSDVRKSEIINEEKPPQRDVTGEENRIGVFVCHCGLNIAGVIKVPDVVKSAGEKENVVFSTNTIYACSQENQEDIKKAIKDNKLNRVVLAACTPRNLEPLFRKTVEEAGLNPYLFEMTNIREHSSWVHSKEPEKATSKAKELVNMGIAKAGHLSPEEKGKASIDGSALVIGGGIAGMTSALEISRQGFKVDIIEKSSKLGGAINEAHTLFMDESEPTEILTPILNKVKSQENITVHLNSKVSNVEGYTGNFKIKIKELNGSKNDQELKSGAILLATGSRELKPEGSYLYGKNTNVLTLRDLEKALVSDDFSCDNMAIIQCVDARNDERPYCSRTCCLDAIKNAIVLKKKNPKLNIYILYRDIMTFGLYEEYYRESQEKYGIKYIRYTPSSPPTVNSIGDKLSVNVYDTHLGQEIEIEVDKLLLSTPQIPSEGIDELQKVLRVPTSSDGFFMEAHPKLRPLRFTLGGLYLAGNCQSPKEVSQVIAQATGVASRITALLSQEMMETEANTAVVDPNSCIGCGRCMDVCNFRAISLEANHNNDLKSVINSAVCKGCGACSSVCPNAAITARLFTNTQIYAMIDELLEEA
jgi:heterodisulfide reductase subunit A|tara:strand:+ start:6807 stop:9836 length:3030 start_codon:yes stop_codon:yes gene_type:complete